MSPVEFQLLGPLRLRVAGAEVDLGSAKQRCVLAALLWAEGRPVPMDDIIDRVWAEDPPSRARCSVYSYVARLRARLRVTCAKVRRTACGYELIAPGGSVDLAKYRTLVVDARLARTPISERARLLRDAHRLWQGTPLAGVPGDWAQRVRDGLTHQHIGVLAEWARVATDLGRHGEVIDTLTRALADYWLAEPLVEQLMRAQLAAGYRERSLSLYRAFRHRLAAELGVHPSACLRRLEAQAMALHL